MRNRRSSLNNRIYCYCTADDCIGSCLTDLHRKLRCSIANATCSFLKLLPNPRFAHRRTGSHHDLLQQPTSSKSTSAAKRPHRLVVRTSRCGRDNPGSALGVVIFAGQFSRLADLQVDDFGTRCDKAHSPLYCVSPPSSVGRAQGS